MDDSSDEEAMALVSKVQQKYKKQDEREQLRNKLKARKPYHIDSVLERANNTVMNMYPRRDIVNLKLRQLGAQSRNAAQEYFPDISQQHNLSCQSSLSQTKKGTFFNKRQNGTFNSFHTCQKIESQSFTRNLQRLVGTKCNEAEVQLAIHELEEKTRNLTSAWEAKRDAKIEIRDEVNDGRHISTNTEEHWRQFEDEIKQDENYKAPQIKSKEQTQRNFLNKQRLLNYKRMYYNDRGEQEGEYAYRTQYVKGTQKSRHRGQLRNLSYSQQEKDSQIGEVSTKHSQIHQYVMEPPQIDGQPLSNPILKQYAKFLSRAINHKGTTAQTSLHRLPAKFHHDHSSEESRGVLLNLIFPKGGSNSKMGLEMKNMRTSVKEINQSALKNNNDTKYNSEALMSVVSERELNSQKGKPIVTQKIYKLQTQVETVFKKENSMSDLDRTGSALNDSVASARPRAKIHVHVAERSHKAKKSVLKSQDAVNQPLTLKEFSFEQPELYYNKNFVERIPKFLLKQGQQSIARVITEMKLQPEIARKIKVVNDA